MTLRSDIRFYFNILRCPEVKCKLSFVRFVYGCFMCVLFIALCNLCSYVVLFLLRAIWLLTQHGTKQLLELNDY
jgi:hypothetical protein